MVILAILISRRLSIVNKYKLQHESYALNCMHGWVNPIIESNLNSSNTDGSFNMANSNSFLNSYEILSIAQENKY